jgi:hypothetical protein
MYGWGFARLRSEWNEAAKKTFVFETTIDALVRVRARTRTVRVR